MQDEPLLDSTPTSLQQSAEPSLAFEGSATDPLIQTAELLKHFNKPKTTKLALE